MSATACVLLRHDVQPRWIGDLLAAYCHTPGCSCGLIVSDHRPDSLPCAEPVTVSPERSTRPRQDAPALPRDIAHVPSGAVSREVADLTPA